MFTIPEVIKLLTRIFAKQNKRFPKGLEGVDIRLKAHKIHDVAKSQGYTGGISENQLKHFLAFEEQGAKKNILKVPEKKGEVFDLTGKKIDTSKPILGGKNVPEDFADGGVAGLLGERTGYKDGEDVTAAEIRRQERIALAEKVGQYLKFPSAYDEKGNKIPTFSKTGPQQVEGAPEGATSDKEFTNFIMSLDIPITEKIDLLGEFSYGKFRDKREYEDKMYLDDPKSWKGQKVGIGYNKEGEGFGGHIKYDIGSGEPEAFIKWSKQFADGGRVPYQTGTLVDPRMKNTYEQNITQYADPRTVRSKPAHPVLQQRPIDQQRPGGTEEPYGLWAKQPGGGETFHPQTRPTVRPTGQHPGAGTWLDPNYQGHARSGGNTLPAAPMAPVAAPQQDLTGLYNFLNMFSAPPTQPVPFDQQPYTAPPVTPIGPMTPISELDKIREQVLKEQESDPFEMRLREEERIRQEGTLGPISLDDFEPRPKEPGPEARIGVPQPTYKDPLSQDQLMAGYEEYKSNNPNRYMGAQAIIPATLPGGFDYTFSSSPHAIHFNDYLESIGQAPYQRRAQPIAKLNAAKFNQGGRVSLAGGGLAPLLGEPTYADGGRTGFKGKKFDPKRRTVLKGIAALAALPVIGKYFKWAKPLAKTKVADLTSVPIKNIKGMPEWYPSLVNKIIKEGKQIESGAERVIVHQAKLPNSKTPIHVTQELDTGNVVVDIGMGKHGFADGHLGQPVRLEYKASEVIEPSTTGGGYTTSTGKEVYPGMSKGAMDTTYTDKTKQGMKTKEEFWVEEAEFTGGHPENIKFEESSFEKFGEHGSNFDEVEKFATGKVKKVKPTKKKLRTDWAEGHSEAQADAAADMADDFASGGRVPFGKGKVVKGLAALMDEFFPGTTKLGKTSRPMAEKTQLKRAIAGFEEREKVAKAISEGPLPGERAGINVPDMPAGFKLSRKKLEQNFPELGLDQIDEIMNLDKEMQGRVITMLKNRRLDPDLYDELLLKHGDTLKFQGEFDRAIRRRKHASGGVAGMLGE